MEPIPHEGATFVPVESTETGDELAEPSLTMTVDVKFPSPVTLQLRDWPVPAPHPLQVYVRGSPSGSDPVADTVLEQFGWQLPPPVALTVGAPFVAPTVTVFVTVLRPSPTVKVAVAPLMPDTVHVAEAVVPVAHPDHEYVRGSASESEAVA